MEQQNKQTEKNKIINLYKMILISILFIFIGLTIFPLIIKYMDSIVAKIGYVVYVGFSLVIGYWLLRLFKEVDNA